MPSETMATDKGDQLTIDFYGLCLFAVGKNGWVEVFCAQPHGHAHPTRRRKKLPTGRFGTEGVPNDKRLPFGLERAGPVDIQGLSQTTDLTALLGDGQRIKRPLPSEAHGVRILLRGGALSIPEVPKHCEDLPEERNPGDFIATMSGGTTRKCCFTHVARWTGPVESGTDVTPIELWNMPANEGPRTDLHNSTMQCPELSEDDRERSVTMHFTAYYGILGHAKGPKITFAHRAHRGVEERTGITVSSCPSALVTVDQNVPTDPSEWP